MEKMADLLVKHVRLHYSQRQGNVLELKVINRKDRDLKISILILETVEGAVVVHSTTTPAISMICLVT